MSSDALDLFLSRATPFESWRVPLDPDLRRAVIWSGMSIGLTLFAIWMLPGLLRWSESDYFVLLRTPFQRILWVLYTVRTELILFNLASLALYVVLLIATNQLQAGRVLWHRVATVEATIGALNAFVLALESAIVLINLVVWIVALILAAIIFMGILAGLAGASGQ